MKSEVEKIVDILQRKNKDIIMKFTQNPITGQRTVIIKSRNMAISVNVDMEDLYRKPYPEKWMINFLEKKIEEVKRRSQ